MLAIETRQPGSQSLGQAMTKQAADLQGVSMIGDHDDATETLNADNVLHTDHWQRLQLDDITVLHFVLLIL